MAKNQVQFQRDMTLTEFMGYYGTEEQCYEALFKLLDRPVFDAPIAGMKKADD